MTTAKMTPEQACQILRRTPLSPWDQAVRLVAIRTLVLAGYDRRAIEMEGMTTLDGVDVDAMAEAAHA